jgi:PAS domain S-box-containing protein
MEKMTGDTSIISQFLDLAGVIIVVIDSSQKVSYINKKGCEVLGYAEDDILGKNWFDTFLPEKIGNDIKTVFGKLMGGEIEIAEYFDNVIRTKGGDEKIIAWHNTVLRNDAGTIIGTLSFGEDITERRRAEDKREKLIQELQDKVIELKSLKMKIPICSWDKKDMKGVIEKHFNHIAKEGRCPDCLKALKMLSKRKE